MLVNPTIVYLQKPLVKFSGFDGVFPVTVQVAEIGDPLKMLEMDRLSAPAKGNGHFCSRLHTCRSREGWNTDGSISGPARCNEVYCG
jgi:hypothetical protein